MELKPGYKQTEVGVIPSDWDVSTVGNLFRITAGGDVDRKRSQSFFDEVHRYPIYSNALTNLGLYGYCSYADHPKGSLTITARGMVGHANFRDHDYTAIGRVLVLQPNVKVAGVYFAELINNTINFADESTGVPQLTAPQISKYQLPVPSFPEQQAVAEALSDADALIESLDQLIAKKRQIKQGAMQELLTGKRRLPGFSGDWEDRSLFELAGGRKELFDDGDWIESEHITEDGIRLIQTGNIGVGSFIEKGEKKYISEESFGSLRCKEIKQGDLLICRLAEPAGRACVLPELGESKTITSVDVTIFRPPLSVANRVFLANVFSTAYWFNEVSDRSGGTTHKRISRGSLGGIRVTIPQLDEQTAIATILSDMDTELAALESRLAKARQIKQGMMQELLTGRIRLL